MVITLPCELKLNPSVNTSCARIIKSIAFFLKKFFTAFSLNKYPVPRLKFRQNPFSLLLMNLR